MSGAIAVVGWLSYGIARRLFGVVKIIFTHKILLIALIVVAGYFIITANINRSAPPANPALSYNSNTPSISAAPYLIQTSTRILYAGSLKITDTEVILTEWYDYNQNKWEKHATPLPLERSEIKLTDRRRVNG